MTSWWRDVGKDAIVGSLQRVGGEDLVAVTREQWDHDVDTGAGLEGTHGAIPHEHIRASGVEGVDLVSVGAVDGAVAG